jgi:hypothetical protein
MPHFDAIVPDPNVHIGHVKVLQRTDGSYIGFDTTKPMGSAMIGPFRSLDGAIRYLENRLGMKAERG